jgi:DNA-binding NtrC family response regulator
VIASRFALIVDPDEIALSSTVNAFRHAGYHVTAVTSFDDAHRQISATNVDILISRARLGMFHAIHLAHVLRSANPHACTVILSEEPDTALERELATLNGMLVPSRITIDALVSLVGMLSDCKPPSSAAPGVARAN